MKCYQVSNKIRIEKFPLYLSISSDQWSWLSSGSWRFGLNLTAVRIMNFLMNSLLNLKLKIVNNEISSLISNLEKWNLISVITASKSMDSSGEKIDIKGAKSEQLSNPWISSLEPSPISETVKEWENTGKKNFFLFEDSWLHFILLWYGLYLFSKMAFVFIFLGKFYCELSNYEAKFLFFTMLYVIVFKIDVNYYVKKLIY